VVETLAHRTGVHFPERRTTGSPCLICETRIGGVEAVLAKPLTFMNRSGVAAAALLSRYESLPEDLVAVHDDADLLLGKIRIRRGGGAGGHRGVRSLSEILESTGFPRIKLGVRGEDRDRADLVEYVLEPFLQGERAVVEALVALGADATERWIESGIEEAMAVFNGRTAVPDVHDDPPALA
jgi:PTH1 family peptidyl-tRNA hydrolase